MRASTRTRRTGGVHPGRIQALNAEPVRRGRYVLYWMQASCRAEWNHALEHAILRANALRLPVVACFGLTGDFPEANARHYTFLVEGLRDVRAALAKRSIPLAVRRGAPDAVAADLAQRASLVVTDRGYLRIQRAWRARAAESVDRLLEQVETDVVVPVEAASHKEEYAAATLRPRIWRLAREYLTPPHPVRLRAARYTGALPSLRLEDPAAVVRSIGADPSVPPVPGVAGGSVAGRRRLRAFVRGRLRRFHLDRNDPSLAGQSGLSPYLHFGQVSAVEAAHLAMAHRGAGPAAFLEELVVRRELSMNFTHFNDDYDAWSCLPGWCRATLEVHAVDPRPARYAPEALELAQTGDPYWNAAQTEMVRAGTMHGYMRMYWGKRILEWTDRPEDALRIALALNNRYQLDGRDPNSFAGVAWCFGKHDRPWAERPVFGTVRYMNAAGLRRKFDIDAYVERVARLAAPGAAR